MPNKFDISVQDKNIRAFMNKMGEKAAEGIDKVVIKTSIYGLREIRSKYNKKTGQARSSFIMKKIDNSNMKIISNAPQVLALEYGSRAHTVKPRAPKKFLTIPIKDSVKTPKTRKIKKAALRKLFRELKAASKKKKTPYDVFQSVGIVLAKKADIPTFRARKPIQKIFVPKIQRKMTIEVKRLVRSMTK